jgi:NTE family protein
LTRYKPRLFTTFLTFIFLISTITFSKAAEVFDFNEDDFVVDLLWDKVVDLEKNKRPKIALVLGGGGARGFAHIGVLRLLDAEALPVDLTVGTSMGAIAGAFYCSGASMEKVKTLAEKINWSTISNIDAASTLLLLVSGKMFSNDKLEKFLRDNIGDITFERLKTPLICVATDLNTGEKILLREGNVSFAARASATIPGFFAPVEYRQRHLIDGGISENIPVSAAKLFNPNIIITVAVPADISKNFTKSILEILLQSIYIQGSLLDAQNMAMSDILIMPEVGDISVSDFEKAKDVIKRGEDAARRSLKSIKILVINNVDKKFLFE